jgi:hypothetical protein
MLDRLRLAPTEVKLPPLEFEMPHTTTHGKMAYVSPTVRSVPNPQIKLSAANAIYSSSLYGQKPSLHEICQNLTWTRMKASLPVWVYSPYMATLLPVHDASY